MRAVNRPPEGERAEERQAWLALAAVEGIGPATAWNLVDLLGSARAAWAEGDAHLGPRARASLVEAWRRLRPREMLEQAEGRGDRVLTPVDPGYPETLLHLHDPPCVVYGTGSWSLDSEARLVGVVGSRRATPYGLSIAERMARDLAGRGVVVASGLARGVDGAAHRGSLAGGGPTVAVLGCGLDVDYPREHARLRREIEENGLVLSEYPRGTRPEPWRFPARNRIMAALCEATVVVQAAARSGALITADLALELGRTVLAVPGAVDWVTSQGTLRLLTEGAGVARGAGDVLDALGLVESEAPAPASPEVARVLEVLGAGGGGVDDLVERAGLAPGPAAALLVRMELEGWVRRLPEGVYVAV